MSPLFIPIAAFIMILGVVIGGPIAKAYARKIESQPHDSLPSGEVLTRLNRIEQAVEAIATEVERIAEGQRFTTKLLSKETARSSSAPVTGPLPAPAPASAPPAPSSQSAPQGTILVEAARRS
ncbi:MAG: hypothetical protein ACR2MQ_09355 [Gemmatimonadaceae bacterium]